MRSRTLVLSAALPFLVAALASACGSSDAASSGQNGAPGLGASAEAGTDSSGDGNDDVGDGGITHDGGEDGATTDGRMSDDGGGSDAPDDSDGSGTVYPANVGAATRVPTVSLVNPSNSVLATPRIVTVSFAAMDASLRTYLEGFDDAITSTPYWTSVTSEYCSPGNKCVGPGVSGGHATLNEAAASLYDDASDTTKPSAIRSFLQARITSGALPAPTVQTIYVVYFPNTTKIVLDGKQSCTPTGVNAYHDWMSATSPDGGAPVGVQYAIIPDCGKGQAVTNEVSHELVEASVDPQPTSAPTFLMTDPAWGVVFGAYAEVADLCPKLTTTAGAWTVQRSFSNKAAVAGRNRCVPTPADPYMNAATSKQIIPLAVGESATIDVTGYADQPVAAWPLTAQDWNAYLGGSPYLEVSLDDGMLYPGKTVHLTVKLISAPPFNAQLNGAFADVLLQSHAPGGFVYVWYAAVQVK